MRREIRRLRGGTPYVVEIQEVDEDAEEQLDAALEARLRNEEIERRGADIEEALWRERLGD